MPLLNQDDSMQQHPPTASTFGYSATRIEALGASEYTLVGIAVDASPSVDDFKAEIEQCLKAAVAGCQRSPRADNLLVRVISFNDQVHELHGFKPLPECKGYDGCIDTRGGTAVFDATANLIDSLAGYSETLVANEFGVNGIIFVVTDGEDNASQLGRGAVSEQQRLLDGARAVRARLQKTMKAERLESLVTILVGVNVQDPTVAKYLETFHREAGFSQYVEIKDASPKSLAKLADFTSRSVSAQSQSLGSGGPSQALNF